MLQVKDIQKKYVTGDLVQTALNGVSLNLRDNEFVAILGPSGSGKTTLLNVIGGLDRYDSGDLIINGISTQKYTDRDWDSYRNHTIGFIFQSYNLIPHQTVLANVELALTISGISRAERHRRAKKALEDVGLGNQLHKKPNQMSGGQMQRVAIARALVNNPDILLADEPTGALDSDTSVQVMELLKEVSKDRLVVMVTHNPELAEEYASRIVRVRDGNIIDDTDPYIVDEESIEPPEHKNMGRSSMSFLTALALSFNNLWTKKGRTILTAFAGSIGIIGIALILSLSTGFQAYIDQIQEDTLSTYPLSIQSETADMTATMTAFGAAMAEAATADPGTVKEQQMISQVFAQIGSNDLGAFKSHLDSSMDEIGDTINALKYGYSITPQIYHPDTSEKITKVNPATLFGDLTGNPMMSAYMDSNVFYEMIDNRELLDSQYELLQGRWPEERNEVIMVLGNPTSISDYTAYTIGLRDPEELTDMVAEVMEGNEVEELGDPMQWTYDELMGLKFRVISSPDTYKYNAEYNVWEDMSSDEAHMKALIKDGLELCITGIVCPREGVSASALVPGIAYTSKLTNYVIDKAENAPIVLSQLSDTDVDVFTGNRFDDEEANNGLDFQNMISVDGDMISSAFGMDVSEDYISSLIDTYSKEFFDSVASNSAPAQAAFTKGLSELAKGMLNDYISKNADPATGAATLKVTDAQTIASAYLATEEAMSIITELEDKYLLPADSFVQVYRPLLSGLITDYVSENMPDIVIPNPEQPDTPTEPTTPDESAPPADNTTPPTEPSEPGSSDTPAEPATPAAPEGTLAAAPLAANLITEKITSLLAPQRMTASEAGGMDIPIDPSMFGAPITSSDVDSAVANYLSDTVVTGAAGAMAVRMTEASQQQMIMSELSKVGTKVMNSLAGMLKVDGTKIANAFHFNMSEDELRRLMEAMSYGEQEHNADTNLRSLGYADRTQPTSISIYLIDFAAKERFLAFLDGYNRDMEESGREELVISYTDMTSVLMSSVKTIVDSVSYVLIAFVAVSLIVSSIMIGIITYISVLERTKEIGVLRAIGASKSNISQVFNAETFIIGLCSGLIGIGVTLALIPVINAIIHSLIGSADVSAQLPPVSAVILIILSMILTIIGGLIPSKKAATKDPVIALRSE